MEQIQIRQPKMPAAQSFIQILGTFLAALFIFIAALFSFIKIAYSFIKQLKALVALDLALKNNTSFSQGGKCQRGMNLRISTIYYILLIFRYISFSSHEKA